MEFTGSLKNNYEFRRLYRKGKSAVAPSLVVYCRKNGTQDNKLGLTVSNKVGHAVLRNKIRRRLREIYRLREADFRRGYDLVVVARGRAAQADYRMLERDFLKACTSLGLLVSEAER